MKEKNLTREVTVIVIISFLIFLFISLASFHFNIGANKNIFGIIGYYAGNFLNYIYGFSGYFFITFLFLYSIKVLMKDSPILWDIFLFLIFFTSFGAILTLIFPKPFIIKGEKIYASGYMIKKMVTYFLPYLNRGGSYFIYFSILVISGLLLYRISILEILSKVIRLKVPIKKNKIVEEDNKSEQKIHNIKIFEIEPPLPDSSILLNPKKNHIIPNELINKYEKDLLKKMKNLGIKAEVLDVKIGASVIQFEILPEPSVSLLKFKEIEQDLAMALKKDTIRIVTPIPGKSTVGIEVPKVNREKIFLKEIIESTEFKVSKSALPIGLGETIEGKYLVVDLKEMPHLLIGGASGTGKSMCLHNIIINILFKVKINDVRFLLIDPKMIEFSLYDGIPYLITPVITDRFKAIESLVWILEELEERFKKFYFAKVRDIEQYRKIEKIPYIVIIIDEFSELILNNEEEIKNLLIKIIQRGKTAGIHLIISSQILNSEFIKEVLNNFLISRIAFKLPSKKDSEIIIGIDGAEKLLGNGDMLYYEPGKNLVRIQGTFINQQEIVNIVEHFNSKKN